ncbi:mannose-1-phosphate guanylyltransferase/mannose-6-phosphate isomerase [Aliihoeflea aestuarii]|uniref:mannose-1-phosphate guanylyltransferase/mannose-6-phosphate isomerase n=1 Tax=Aliihoeflea aestuarii TaxID=453840 RepID=UPI002093103D|nr:mannose-1-phosphate guanylyltransferase/mannose-6-phosphate isomerase [Aliihoeflea aestuarii]MCO6391648.1 mannose-1-phosphate guanylyltransferase/mannose-6-phosphate isomerase [Aliihoeflea aestuarii]
MQDHGLIIPVIMAGGSGTRLWPVSRNTMPKQFIEILDEGFSTFQTALRRVSGPEFAPPIVVTGEDFRFLAAVQMQAAGVEGEILLEPAPRDSAAAVAAGALYAAQRDPEAICLVMAADHFIQDDQSFVSDCMKAAVAAGSGRIMTLGIEPTHPSTAYGYIDIGEPLPFDAAFVLKGFVEKPDKARANTYLESGFLWNSGNFLFAVDTMIDELEMHAPDVLFAVREAVACAKHDLDFLRLDAEAFQRSPKISIDYAVMEKTQRAGVVKASFSWSDVGSWDSVYDIKTADDNGNVLEGAVSVLNTRNSLVLSQGPLTTVIGLEDVMVVSTLDAVLVASKDEAPRVKDLVSSLVADGRDEATQHLRIHRPWGWYQRVDLGDRFQVKHICVRPGGTLSLQKHHHRAEHWVVVHGTAEVTIDGVVKHYHENEAAYLPIGCVHRMRNPGKIDLKIIEVQVGSYTGEDDIVRIEDIYARV